MSLEQRLKRLIIATKDYLRRYFNAKNEYLPFLIPLLIGFVICALTLNAFAEITEDLHENELVGFDSNISGYIHGWRTDELTSFFVTVTDLGGLYGYLGIVTVLAIYFFTRHKNWKFPLQVVFVLVLSFLVNYLLKIRLNRARPEGEHLVEVVTLSYPSGHAMSAMAFYGFLIFFTWYYLQKKWQQIALTIICLFLILSIGISRIYLGVHYPSDVMAGFVGGLFWMAFCIVVFNVISIFRKRRRLRNL